MNFNQIVDAAPILAVPNVSTTAKYYAEKLGFEIDFILEDPTLPKYAVVSRDSFSVHLLEGIIDAAHGSKGGINFNVLDVDATYEDLQSRGAFPDSFPTAYDAIREHPPEDKPYGMRDFIMVDPNGYTLVFGAPLDKDA